MSLVSSRRRWSLVVLLSLASWLAPTCPAEEVDGPAAGRERPDSVADAATGAATHAARKQPPENLWQMIVAGGPLNLAFMGFLGLISLVAAAVAMERLANLTRRKIVPGQAVRELQGLVDSRERRLEKFRAVCDQHPSPLTNVVRAGLARVGRPLSEIEKGLEDAAAREMAELRARVRPLSVAANVAPLVGLLGTVVGMLEAFRVASQAGLGKAELLAEGIYLALETTVAGLLIAIPALLFASYFHSRAERFFREISDCLDSTLPALEALSDTRPTDPARGSLSNNPLMAPR
ncbi:MAG TPA: MotA/TolQ/ExbB proton channel family protein [Pirellulales bacterium]|jgi:biopolymer transport protein ExbB|nr:MotA/TolQ/ExbB proton channel family protein [Pirellulales bacterium]